MNKYLKKFDTIRFVATWSIFRNFLEIFYFLELKFKFWIWSGLKPAGTRTGPDRFDRPVPNGIFNPAHIQPDQKRYRAAQRKKKELAKKEVH